MSKEPDDGIVLTEEQKRRRRPRPIAIAVSLGVLVVLFYLVTLVKGPALLGALWQVSETAGKTRRDMIVAASCGVFVADGRHGIRVGALYD